MEISPLVLAKMLLVAFLFSVQVGIFFDFGRAFCSYFSCNPKTKKIKAFYNMKVIFSDDPICVRGKKKINRVLENGVIFLFDIFLVLYSGFGLMKINFAYNDGAFRFFTVLAFLVGFLIYYFVASKIVLFLLELSIFITKYLLISLFGVFGKPFLIIYNNLVKKIKKKCEKIRLRLEKKDKMVYNVNEILYNDENVVKNSSKIHINVRNNKAKGKVKNERE